MVARVETIREAVAAVQAPFGRRLGAAPGRYRLAPPPGRRRRRRPAPYLSMI